MGIRVVTSYNCYNHYKWGYNPILITGRGPPTAIAKGRFRTQIRTKKAHTTLPLKAFGVGGEI